MKGSRQRGSTSPRRSTRGVPLLRQGKLVARQQFPRCGQPSPETVITVGPPVAPAVPEIQANPCSNVARIVVSKLEPGAVVELSTVVPHPTIPGAVVIAGFGEATASKSTGSFDLPATISSTTTSGEPVRLQRSTDPLRPGKSSIRVHGFRYARGPVRTAEDHGARDGVCPPGARHQRPPGKPPACRLRRHGRADVRSRARDFCRPGHQDLVPVAARARRRRRSVGL